MNVYQPPFAAKFTNLPPVTMFCTFPPRTICVFPLTPNCPFTVKDDTVLNDDFSNSFLAQGTSFRLFATNLHRATAEPGESTGLTLGSVWWHWTAPATAQYAIRNFGSYLSFNVSTGDSLSSLIPVVETSTFAGYYDATTGVTYHLRMVGDRSFKVYEEQI